MTGRISLIVSLLAIGAAVAGLIILGDKVVDLKRRVTALEQKPERPAPPPPAPPPEEKPETPEEKKRKEIRKQADEMCAQHLAELEKKLSATPELMGKLREALADEFAFYGDGLIRSIDELKDDGEGGEVYLDSPEFRRGLEERIKATDEKLRGLLTLNQYWTFEEWRKGIRKEPYKLD